MKTIYLDNAAASKVQPQVIAAMAESLEQYYANPSALHEAARQSKAALEQCRATTAGILGVKPHEIIFTAGATEANNLFIQGVQAAYKGSEIVSSPLEHDSIAAQGVRVSALSPQGLVSPAELTEVVTDSTVLISLILVNNETGALQDTRSIRQYINEVLADRAERGVALPLFLHADAAQAPVTQKIIASSLGVDALTINGSKLGGPKQSGCLYISRRIKISPILFGGGQERGLRPGTEALHQIQGFTRALQIAIGEQEEENKRLTEIRDTFEAQLIRAGGIIVASRQPRSPHITSVIFPGADNETLAMQLSDRGIYVGIGSACHAGSGQSRVLSALGYAKQEEQSVVRFSYGYETTKSELERVATVLPELL